MVNSSAVLRGYTPVALFGAAVLLTATACSSSGGGSTASASSTPAATSSGPTGSGTSTSMASECGSIGTPTVTGTGPADPTAAGKQIATTFQEFFDPTTPTDTRIGLLQNGALFAPVLKGFAGNPLAAKATATVTGVAFTGATSANVTFNLCQSGKPALPNAAGKAVLSGVTWKVADNTLCSLVKLGNGGAAVPGCS
ncbi:hypothetical protein [Streptacidiphilus albus]|uniref:hypothetical protein n=1 Tax=Streptacidiphilus albus TaxID=105425 RepID=UPI0005AB8ECB|nr:hypothetical protein [Streptacidiphilus albus]